MITVKQYLIRIGIDFINVSILIHINFIMIIIDYEWNLFS